MSPDKNGYMQCAGTMTDCVNETFYGLSKTYPNNTPSAPSGVTMTAGATL